MDPFASRKEMFYRHSWKAPIGGLFLVGAAGLLSTLVLGLIYGYIMYYIPFIYIKVFIMVGYPFAIGLILSLAVQRGKVRNNLLVGLAGVGFGLLADYMGWVAWIAAALKSTEYLMVFFYPGDILYFMQEVVEVGIYVIGNSRPTGAILYLIWLVEAVVVVGGTAFMVLKLHLDTPFCEECNEWVETERYIGLFTPLTNTSKFKRGILEGNYTVFNELIPSQTGNQFIKLTIYECRTCQNFRLLNVKKLKLSVNSKKQLESNERKVITNLRVTPGLSSALARLTQDQY